MRLRFSYMRQGVPVELEIQGRRLTPEGASHLLATCLDEVESLVRKILPGDERMQNEVRSGESAGVDLDRQVVGEARHLGLLSSEPALPDNEEEPDSEPLRFRPNAHPAPSRGQRGKPT